MCLDSVDLVPDFGDGSPVRLVLALQLRAQLTGEIALLFSPFQCNGVHLKERAHTRARRRGESGTERGSETDFESTTSTQSFAIQQLASGHNKRRGDLGNQFASLGFTQSLLCMVVG